jgi:hypothetical protein
LLVPLKKIRKAATARTRMAVGMIMRFFIAGLSKECRKRSGAGPFRSIWKLDTSGCSRV